MENFDALSDLTMIDNIEFEEKVDIGTLVLTTEPLKIPKIEFTDNENELLENARSNDMHENGLVSRFFSNEALISKVLLFISNA